MPAAIPTQDTAEKRPVKVTRGVRGKTWGPAPMFSPGQAPHTFFDASFRFLNPYGFGIAAGTSLTKRPDKIIVEL
jgi:hypothetical protein